MGSCGLCSIQTRHLFTRVQRKKKRLVCVEKWGESLGGHVVVRNREENVEMSCVYCVVSVLHASLLPLFGTYLTLVFDVVDMKNKVSYVSKTLLTWP